MNKISKTFQIGSATAISLIFLLLNSTVVFANSGPPPSIIWLLFDYKIDKPIDIIGIQLIGCETEECANPILLQQYETCDNEMCLSGNPESDNMWSSTFDCVENKCRLSSTDYEQRPFKIIIQFSDKTRSSEVMSQLPGFMGEQIWRVNVQDSTLTLTQESITQDTPAQIQIIAVRLITSVALELLTVGAYLAFILKAKIQRLAEQLLMVFFINIGTLPIVWIIFPSLGQFQYQGSRYFGALSLIGIFIYFSLLTSIDFFNRQSKRLGATIIMLITMPALIFCSLIISFALGYGDSRVFAQGLPANTILPLSEITVVIVESVLIYVLNRKALPFKHAAAISILMNIASFVLGQAIFH
jgi:hypothetical protein